MVSSRQLTLDFPHRPALGKADFLVSDCNRDAVGWIDRWPGWPGPALALWGPAGCGKTHLAHVWRARSGAVLRSAAEIVDRDPTEALAGHACCVVDVEARRDGAVVADAEALLHLYNTIAELRGHMLIVARQPPARWRVGLADLASRLGAAPAVAIAPPDDALLGALLVKLFHDRQLRVSDDVLVYLMARMARSFAAAHALVEALDATALTEHRDITVPLARAVLARYQADGEEQGEEQD